MKNAVYWDTSALLKLYAPELDSSDYLRLLISQPEAIAISFLHRVELYFALRNKEARGEIDKGSSMKLFATFEQHLSEGRYVLIPWGQDVAQQSHQAMETCLSATPPIRLRSLDGLHLGAVLVGGVGKVVTADTRMQEAAIALNLRIVEP